MKLSKILFTHFDAAENKLIKVMFMVWSENNAKDVSIHFFFFIANTLLHKTVKTYTCREILATIFSFIMYKISDSFFFYLVNNLATIALQNM